jgi:hypothetical protein
MASFKVKNFEKFQHYKDRSPPWIKLYNEVLEDYRFGSLQDASKAHLIAIWLLASRTENELPFDPDWIGKRINATEYVNLQALADAGFILVDQPLQQAEQVASKSLQTPQPDARPEREGETEQRERQSRAEQTRAIAPLTDLDAAVSEWNAMAEKIDLPTVQRLTPARRTQLRSRLAECGGMEGWRVALGKLAASSFCRGGSRSGWRADFDFVLQAKSFTKLMEGGYDDRTGEGRQSSTASAVAGIIGAAN